MLVSFKPVLPKKKFQSSIFDNALNAEGRLYLNGVKKDYEKTFQNWKEEDKPTIEPRIENTKWGLSITVKIVGFIYTLVHEGTRPHTIKPVRVKALRFQSGYNAKTQPGRWESKAGGPFGDVIYTRRAVQHPGFPGRDFSKMIKQIWEKPFKTGMQKALNRAAKESGYGL